MNGSTPSVVRVCPGGGSGRWLSYRLAELKRDEPLASATVVVPTNHLGLALRRSLARQGYLNVRFGVLGRLAEPLGAQRLAAAGRLPLTLPAQEAAILEAIQRVGDVFGEIGSHPALIGTLRELFVELRQQDVPAEGLHRLQAWGQMAEAAIEVYRECQSVLDAAGTYDDADLLDAASDALLEPAGDRPIAEIGHVIVYLPLLRSAAEVRFLQGLATKTEMDLALSWLGDDMADRQSIELATQLGLDWESIPTVTAAATPDVSLVSAPDAGEEVRTVVRQVLAAVEHQRTELRRIAVVYRRQDPYAGLVRDTLDSAAVDWAGLDGRPLSESWAGSSLLGLLNVRERGFRRVDVLAWLASLPETDPGRVSLGDWDRFSRDARVVRGAQQWQARLRHIAEGKADEAERGEATGELSEGRIRYLKREAGAMGRMANFIERLDTASQPPAERTWPALATWAEKLRRNYAPVADGWPDREREADEMVGELIAQLAGAGMIQREATIERFLEALRGTLESRPQSEGRLGSGVAVGTISSIAGMDFDRVFVVGCTERALPAPPPPDPVFPPDGGPDPLGRTERRREEERGNFLAAMAAGAQVTLSFPAWDQDLRPSYPSAWVTEYAVPHAGAPQPTATSLRLGRGAANLLSIPSPDAALESSTTSLNLAEWRARSARAAGPQLSASGLARRDELPLGRYLFTRAERRSERFTEFDGNLEALAGQLPLLTDGLTIVHSPSTVETWATCPFNYLLGRVFRVEETDRPEQDADWGLSALARGSLVHDILERFLRELREAGRPVNGDPYTAAEQHRLEEIAGEEFAKVEVAGDTGNPLAWENDRRAILADLRTFLQHDEDLRQDGLMPMFFEQGFGMGKEPWDQLQVDLGEGRIARIRGRIDRVDLGPDPTAPAKARLIDYKTGSASPYKPAEFDKDATVAGTRVQPSVYSEAIRAKHPGVAVESMYWFVSAKGEFKRVTVADEPGRLQEVLGVMDRALRAGAFPQVPGPEDRESWKNCFYCAYNRICPTGRDQLRERKRAEPGPQLHLELVKEDAGGE